VKLGRIEVPAEPPGPARTLVLLHGFGADERDLLPLARELDPRLRTISLQAPVELEFGGRAWYRLQQGPDGISFDPEEVAEAERVAREAIEEIAREDPRPILCGFSQGAGMALSAVLGRPDLAAGVLALSAVPPRQAAQSKGLRVFLAHGTFDPLVPVQAARATRELLQKLGADVTFREYPMGHMICAEEMADARAFVQKIAEEPARGEH
jgi:phospholipase/carboxylesterase